MNHLISFLHNRLKKPLPGRGAQITMRPTPLEGARPRQMEAPENARPSSVLVLLFPNSEQQPELVLTLRSNEIDHGGQISFPGGGAEEGETPAQTALRETQEEIGVTPESVTVIGQLSELYVPHSHNKILPVVGYTDTRPKFKLNPGEVEEVFAVEVESLLHKKNITEEIWELKHETFRVPYWTVHPVPLWGATAMMLSEFLKLYREFKSED